MFVECRKWPHQHLNNRLVVTWHQKWLQKKAPCFFIWQNKNISWLNSARSIHCRWPSLDRTQAAKKGVLPISTHYIEFNGFGQYKIGFVSDKTELTTDALSKAAFYRTFSCYGLWANCLSKIIHTKATPIATIREKSRFLEGW